MMPAIRWMAAAAMLGGLAGLCAAAEPAPGAAAQPLSKGADLAGYTLAWSDEFDGAVLDTNKWRHRTGARLLSFQKPENVSLSNGLLRLALKKENAGGLHYTAGGVISLATFKYGYYEARFRCPAAAGWHTSFWTIYHGVPGQAKAQEIDICEQDAANHCSYSAGVIDWSGRGGKKSVNFGRVYYRDTTPDFTADFHVWGCEFTPAVVKFFLDGKLTHQTDAAKFPHGEQTVWLTSVAALWGNPTKPAHVDDGGLPAFADFDWVRVYRK